MPKEKKSVPFYCRNVLKVSVRPLLVVFGIVLKHLDPIRQDILYI